jgi:uncharacterized protein with PIN domain
MFIDASALVAIIAQEPEATALDETAASGTPAYVSDLRI